MMATCVRVTDEAGQAVVPQVTVADTYWLRLRGLMFKGHLGRDEGLLLTKCNAIHCWFMRIPIDVVFLDENGVVVRIIPNMKPWRLSPIVRKAKSVLECAAGTVQRLGIQEGQKLSLE